MDNSKLELTRSLSIEEIDLKETLVTAKSWKSAFLQRGGFVYLLKVFFNRSRTALNVTAPDAHDNVSSEESCLQTLANGLLLKLVRTFLLAAMSSGGTNYHDIAELVRRRSSENKSFLLNTTANATVLDLQESYSNDSGKMISRDLQTLFDQTFSMPSSPSNLQELMHKSGISPKISALLIDLGTTPPPGEDFLSLVRQISDGGSRTVAENILENVNFVDLQANLFNILAISEKSFSASYGKKHNLKSKQDDYNTKRIVERAIGLWVALTAYEPSSFQQFLDSDALCGYFLVVCYLATRMSAGRLRMRHEY